MVEGAWSWIFRLGKENNAIECLWRVKVMDVVVVEIIELRLIGFGCCREVIITGQLLRCDLSKPESGTIASFYATPHPKIINIHGWPTRAIQQGHRAPPSN